MKDKRVFIGGGMDLDSDPRNVQPNNYGYALNCLCNDTNGNNLGAIENRKGNIHVSIQLPPGTNKTVGSCADVKRNAIVYMVYNSSQRHSILRYNIDDNTIDKILFGEAVLNFQPDYTINSMNIMGDLLYWTDGYFDSFTYDPATSLIDSGFNPPRKINMVKAYNYTNGVAVPDIEKYSAIDRQVLDRIKYPPLFSPEVGYSSNSQKKQNFLIGKLFQFSYSYVYDDNEKSVYSPYSKVPVPTASETNDGKWTQPYYNNNVIWINIDTGHETVKKINLFVKEQNIGDWYKFDTIDKYGSDGSLLIPNNVIYEYSPINDSGFYNDGIYTSEDQVDASRQFDYVGQTIDSTSILNDNRLVDGGIVEDYDNVDINVELNSRKVLLNYGSTIPFIATLSPPGDAFITFPAVIYPFYTYTININDGSSTYSYSYTPQDSDVPTYPKSILDAFVNIINAGGVYGAGYLDPTIPTLFISGISIVTANGAATPSSSTSSAIVKTFKQGKTHLFGIRYYDRANRSGGSNKSTDSIMYIPTEMEYAPNILYANEKDIFLIDWKVKHIPPEWATHWQWVYAKNTPNFLQYYYKKAALDGNGNIRIDVPAMLIDWKTNVPKVVRNTYTFQKGDRVRFMYFGSFGSNVRNYFNGYIDVEISGFDSTSNELIIEDFGFATYNVDPSSLGWDFCVVELYTPSKIDDNNNYYEIGEVYPVFSPHTAQRRHGGATQNQDYLNPITTPAEGTFTGADVYLRQRFAIDPPLILIEDQYYSDFYISNSTDIGRVAPILQNSKRGKRAHIRYSGQYLQDTLTNNLSRFYFLDKEDVNNEYGSITGLRQIGYTLKVLQERRNNSFGVGVQELVGANGVAIPVVSSTKVLSDIRPSPLTFGCVNPESLCVSGRYMYFYDYYTGGVIRDDANGMDNISKKGLWTFFKTMQGRIKNAVKSKVFINTNSKYSEIFCTFVLFVQDSNDRFRYEVESIVWNELTNNWTTYVSYFVPTATGVIPVDYFGALGTTTVSFLDGQLYLENEGTYGEFYGIQRPQIVTVISNVDTEKKKVFTSLGLTTTANKNNWVAELTTPATDKRPSGGITHITNFTEKEEAIYADIMRDENTPMGGTALYKRVNGDSMRSDSLSVRLENNSDNKVVLYSAIVNSIPSEKSK